MNSNSRFNIKFGDDSDHGGTSMAQWEMKDTAKLLERKSTHEMNHNTTHSTTIKKGYEAGEAAYLSPEMTTIEYLSMLSVLSYVLTAVEKLENERKKIDLEAIGKTVSNRRSGRGLRTTIPRY